MKLILALSIAMAPIISACGGTPGQGVASPTAGITSLATQPQALSFSTQTTQPSTLTVTGGTGTYRLAVSDTRLVDVSTVAQSSLSTTFAVTPIAGGTTTIAISDTASNSATVPVAIDICLPPSPAFAQVYPSSTSSGVRTDVGAIWLASPTNGAYEDTITQYKIRLLASDNSIIETGPLALTNGPPPSGSAAISGYTVYSTASVPTLRAGLRYQVQIISMSFPCLPPVVVGSFST